MLEPPDPPDPPANHETIQPSPKISFSYNDDSTSSNVILPLLPHLTQHVSTSELLSSAVGSLNSTSTSTRAEDALTPPKIVKNVQRVSTMGTHLPQVIPTPPPRHGHIHDTGFGFSDGGFLECKTMATGWWLSCDGQLVTSDGSLLQHEFASNNVAEYTGLILCLKAAHKIGYENFIMTMDSLLVVSHMKGLWTCNSPHLLTLLQEARMLADAFDTFIIFHTYREDNSVADALCNFAFDGVIPPEGNWNSAIEDLNWKHDLNLIQYWLTKADLCRNWNDVWSLVMAEVQSVGPMIRDEWKPATPAFDAPHHPLGSITVIKIDDTINSPVGSPWTYVFTPEGLFEMQRLVAECGLPWDSSRFQKLEGVVNKHGVTVFKYPTLDAAYTTLILSRSNWDLKRLIRAWRGQTSVDMRPNKKLSFSRLENVTSGYDDQVALKSLIESGYQLHWKAEFKGVRPLPKNHLSAELHHEIMGAQILKNYHSGRLIMLNAQDVAKHVPGFTTSPYACVPKAHKPLTHACRPIHDQSSPDGLSVNAGLDPTLRPHAQWPASRAIADRILSATKLYGTEALYGFNTDIADAFLNIGLHEDDVPINGGLLPASDMAALATTAIFGNCESPGAFRILNCVSHIHHSNSSYINNDNTPFDVRFYVDDGNCIEPNIGDRLLLAEQSLRASTELVFGPNCIQEAKTTPWAKVFTSLGFEWNLHDGTVSIPEEKLSRVRACLLEFSAKRTASISEFRSIVGKLRHVSTVCPPAKSLMHMLGLKLHSKHHVNGRQQRPVSKDMRSELRWWAEHLTPASFYKLPVEWMGTSLPPVDQWIHIYSKPDVGIWLVDFSNQSSSFHVWMSSLSETVVTAIELQLDPNATRQNRMFHTRFILNECKVARMLNSGSSADSSLQLALKQSGLWQLRHRHRFTATTTKWENMPDLLPNICTSHISNFSNFLSSQILCNTKSAEHCQNPLINGNLPRLAKERSRRMGRIFATGSHSRFPFNFPQSFLMSSPPPTSPRSWRGLPSLAVNMDIMPKMKVINSPPTRSKSRQSSGLTSIIEIPFLNSKVQRCLSLKPATAERSTCHIQNSLFTPRCCPAALPNSVLGPRPKGNWRGGVYYYNSSTLEGQGKSGTPVDKQNTPCQPRISNPNPDQIIVSRSVTWSSGINLETASRSANTIKPSQSPSPLITPRLTRWDEGIQSRWESLDTDPFARSRALSWHSEQEERGKQHIKTTHCRVELKPRESTQLSRRQLQVPERTQTNTLSTQSELDMPPCYLKSDMTNLSSGSLDDGQVKSWPFTLGYPVGCC